MKKFIFKNAFVRVLTLVAVALFSHSCIADWPGGEDPANPSNPSAKSMLGFSFTKALNPALASDISATISGTDVVLSVPFGTDISALKPSITYFAASVSPATETAQNFSSPVAYTVTAKDGSTQVYTVKVTVVTTSTKDITSFVIKKSLNPDLIDDVTATITGTNITAKLPFGTPLTAIKPTILQNGNIVNSASEVAKDFTNAVSYTVTAQDNSTQVYTVTLTTSQLGDVNPNGTVVGDVYIAGSESNGTKTVAKYWKNGVATSLTDGTQNASASSIIVVGTDVYVAGIESNGTKNVVKVWKNGVATNLTDGTQNANLRELFVVGTDFYVAGVENNGTKDVAKYWKNGVATSLTDGSNNAFLNGITVVGSDVYAAGREFNGTIDVLSIWKNGVVNRIGNNTDVSNGGNKVIVKGEDVYVSGFQNNGTKNVATVWKNGVATSLTDGTQNANARYIAINGLGDVYAAGFENNGTKDVAKYWKNGVATSLSDGTQSAQGQVVAAFGNDLYLVINESNGTKVVLKYWKNGVVTSLTDGTQNASGNHMFVVR